MDALTKLLKTVSESKHLDSYAKEYNQQSQMIVIPDFLSQDAVQQFFLPEVQACNKYINRVNVPGFKKSGSVSAHWLQKSAPNLFGLYMNELLTQFISNIVGESLKHCPLHDPHAVALYYYTEPGDHIKIHYDKSFYKGKRFTVLLGIVQDSNQSNLICYPGATRFNRKKNPLTVKTHPGVLVIFNGDTLWHEVSPLGENETRIILTMEFLTDTRISLVNKMVSDLKDRYLYFGKSKQPETI